MISLWKIFWVFFKLGAFTIGGGLIMVPTIYHEVMKQKWSNKDEFADMLAMAQSAPGLIVVNIAIFIGNKLRGLKGSIVATLGSIIPPFIIILIVAMLFKNFQDNEIVIKVFKAIRPVAVALIGSIMLQLGIDYNKNIWAWGLSVLALALVAFAQISPIYIMIATIIFSIAIYSFKDKNKSK